MSKYLFSFIVSFFIINIIINKYIKYMINGSLGKINFHSDISFTTIDDFSKI